MARLIRRTRSTSCGAIKSNTTMALRRIMNDEGAGGDCFSAGEVYASFVTGADPEKMLLNGSNRDAETLRMALEIGLRITLDHMDDLEEVDRLARGIEHRRPGIDPHQMRTAQPGRPGIDLHARPARGAGSQGPQVRGDL